MQLHFIVKKLKTIGIILTSLWLFWYTFVTILNILTAATINKVANKNGVSYDINKQKYYYSTSFTDFLKSNFNLSPSGKNNLAIAKEIHDFSNNYLNYSLGNSVREIDLVRIFNNSERANSKLQIQNLFFLKTHQTSSDTIQNIIFRYVKNNKLKIALPKNGASDFCYPMHLRVDCVQNLSTLDQNNEDGFNVLAHGSRFNKDENQDILPKIFRNNIPFKFTILRDPVYLFPAMFSNFIGADDHDNNDNNITNFLLNPKQYFQNLDQKNDHFFEDNQLNMALVRNGMTFDLGYPGIYTFSPPGIKQVIREIDEAFDFVMIMEYFNESLILLKYFLNWTNQDLIYFHKVENQKENKSDDQEKTDAVSRLIRDWSTVDALLYNHFNRTLWRKIKIFGEKRMEDEVREFKLLLNDTQPFLCKGSDEENNNDDFCKSEEVFTNEFYKNQYGAKN